MIEDQVEQETLGWAEVGYPAATAGPDWAHRILSSQTPKNRPKLI